MYDPPQKEDYSEHENFDYSMQLKAYNEGHEAYFTGCDINDNPYKPSGHERDTTFSDELHYKWYVGYVDASLSWGNE